MKNKWIAVLLILILSVSLAACGSKQAPGRNSASAASAASGSASDEASVPGSGESSDSEPGADEELDARVSEILSGMTTEQKLAQMMIVALRSDPENTYTTTELTPEYVDLLKKYDFGGMILFQGNIVDAEQTVTLIRDCQDAVMKSDRRIPMLVGVDQEGGLVNRVTFGTVTPGNMALGAADDTDLTEDSAEILSRELSVLGFNMDFAPDSDVNSNPNNPIIGVRSFSDDPDITAKHTAAFVSGLHRNHVTAVLKHFPGHGNVGEDSHTHLPASDYTLEELRACDLIPFKAGIEAGTDMIMTAHIQYPKIEKETYSSGWDGEDISLPATLSHTIITGLLREEMGYDGIIVTDSMGMDAIAEHFDKTDAAVLAINAGVDMLLCPVDLYQGGYIDTFPDMDSYMEKLMERVEAGDIKTEELDDSVSRIIRLKLKKGIIDEPFSETLDEQIESADVTVGCAEHCEKEWMIAERGLTLLKNKGEMLPLDGTDGRHTLILVPGEYFMPTIEYVKDRLESDTLLDVDSVTALNYSDMWSGNWELEEALSEADNVLILSDETEKNELVSSVIEQMHEKNGKAALLSLNLPYDAACYPEADAIMCAYNAYGTTYDQDGEGPFSLNVAACICAAFEESVPRGTLPVNVPKLETNENGESVYSDEILFERGFGLKNWEE